MAIDVVPQDVIAALNALGPSDFDEPGDWEILGDLCDELDTPEEILATAPAMFRLMERCPDADLGTPGPLVHTLERAEGYEEFLRTSVAECPTQTTVWMVNRILNAAPRDADTWLMLLDAAERHPLASDACRADARDFLAFQGEQ